MKTWNERQLEKGRKLSQATRAALCCALAPIPPLVVAACMSVPFPGLRGILVPLAVWALLTTPSALLAAGNFGFLARITSACAEDE